MKEVCNLGLGKLGASRVNNLSPPISTLENKCAAEYPHWKNSELGKRRWTFATKLYRYTALTTLMVSPPDGRLYQFNVPGDLIRAIRPKNCTWVRRGEFFYDIRNTIDLEYIRNVPDNEITDPLFVDVLACRVAVECAELATQSPAKKRDAQTLLQIAEMEAGRMNAFMLEPHETAGDDTAYSWDLARANPAMSGGDTWQR
jgi:hypothetical protein